MLKSILGKTFISKRISSKLTFSFSITTLLILLLTAAFFWFDSRDSKIEEITSHLYQVKLKVANAYNLEKDFYIEETINSDFYETGKSKFVVQHQQLMQEVRADLKWLQDLELLSDADISHHIDDATDQINQFANVFDTLVALTYKRGFKSHGIEGKMRQAIGRVNNSGYPLDETKILSIRRREKDYFLRKDDTYVKILKERIVELEKDVQQSIKNKTGQAYVLNALSQYQDYFLQLVALDHTIGFQEHTGLRKELDDLSTELTENIQYIEEKVHASAEELRRNIELFIVFLFIGFIAINFLLNYFTTKSLSEPIEGLSEGIHEVIASDFKTSPTFDYTDRQDELGQLSSDFQVMVSKMKEHNYQIFTQKEQLKSAYEDIQQLGQLGKDITATLVVDEIITIVQRNLQKLMDVNAFWIGVHQPEEEVLEYKGGVLGEQEIAKSFRQPLHVNDKLGVWCFKHEEEIIINDLDQADEQFHNFSSATGEEMESIVYLPLLSNNSIIGVFSVQHIQKDYFTPVRVNLLRNLASYASIAIDNALIYQNQERLIDKRTAKVRDQKEEIATQKENIEKAFANMQLLSEIGRTLSTYLSVESIIEKMHEQVGQLMDTHVFGLGLYHKESNTLHFPASIENGERKAPYQNELTDINRFSVWCFTQQEEFIVNDLERDVEKYGFSIIEELRDNKETSQSIIYLPLQSQGATIGVIGVQSLQKNAYDSNHLSLLRNIAVYAAIALSNANAYQQITEQRNQVEQTSRKVRASINYAKRIQEALLPSREAILTAFPESFVFFRPRDIVSGDFYWFHQKGDLTFIAALDCTGHGVPGAFMSMIGNELINEAVIRMRLTEPSEVLSHMHKGIREALRQYETDNRDGMDMTFCAIDKAKGLITFAGANNPIIYVQNGELEVIKGNRFPVGGEQREMVRNYQQHVIDISEPTTFYLFTDGYQDQFGGKNGKKFMVKKFRKLLHSIAHLPMPEQEQILSSTLSKWMNIDRQVDDILVMGIRL